MRGFAWALLKISQISAGRLMFSEPGKPENGSRSAQLAIESGKWKMASLCQFQIGRVIYGEAKAVGDVERFAPCLRISMLVRCDIEPCEIFEGGAAET